MVSGAINHAWAGGQLLHQLNCNAKSINDTFTEDLLGLRKNLYGTLVVSRVNNSATSTKFVFHVRVSWSVTLQNTTTIVNAYKLKWFSKHKSNSYLRCFIILDVELLMTAFCLQYVEDKFF